MDKVTPADSTALPIEDRPELHKPGPEPGRSAPIPLAEDKELLEGQLPADRFDDERMRDLPSSGH